MAKKEAASQPLHQLIQRNISQFIGDQNHSRREFKKQFEFTIQYCPSVNYIFNHLIHHLQLALSQP